MMNLTESMEAFIRLVQIPSVTGSSREKEACAFLENILSQYGISSERIARSEERPNLLACLRAEHPEEEPVILISHVDVVDGNQECWLHPVFGGERQAGRIWGRGTLDTKQLTMMELYAFLRLKEKQKELRRDVWFLATIDEEGGSSYGMEYVKSVRPELFRNAMVFNEGGGFPLRINGRDYMMLTVGEKGVLKVRIWAEGTGGHASAPGDDQSIQKLAEALRKIFAAEEKLACGSRHTQDTIREIAGTDEWDNPVAADIFGYAGQNSIGMRNYQIGERSNVIPAKAEVILEFKVLPGTSKEDIQEFLDRELSGTAAKYEILSFEPGFESRFDCSGLKELVQDLNTACEHFGFQGQVMPMLALGRTDGRFFGSEGSLVYGCSPLLMGDSFDVVLPKVHGNDESILEESYLFGCRVMDEILQKNCLKKKKDKEDRHEGL